MILNAYALLDGFVTLLRLGVAVLVLGLGMAALRDWRRGVAAAATARFENRAYLLFSLALLLLLLNLASWPLLYLLLQSYVTQWPGVMCIYGVTQVGAGSAGPSRFLPGLLATLQVLKPALVFVSGVWVVLYLANRHTPEAPLRGRVLGVLLTVGVLAAIDAVAEGAYLLIPKHEEFLAGGCCTGVFDDAARLTPAALVGERGRRTLTVSYYLVNGLMIAAMFACLGRLTACGGFAGLTWLLAGAMATLVVSSVFLIDIAAPALLGLPHHHCPYDLIGHAPESILAAASFAGGTFAVGWAWALAWLADCPETRPFLCEQIRRTLAAGWFGYVASLAMVTVELALS